MNKRKYFPSVFIQPMMQMGWRIAFLSHLLIQPKPFILPNYKPHQAIPNFFENNFNINYNL
jgi:hypothetical protein